MYLVYLIVLVIAVCVLGREVTNARGFGRFLVAFLAAMLGTFLIVVCAAKVAGL